MKREDFTDYEAFRASIQQVDGGCGIPESMTSRHKRERS